MFCSRDTWRVKFVCQVQSPCRAMRMSLCPSIWRSRWAWRCIWHVTPNPETGNSQPGSDRAFASPEAGDAWLKAERGEKRFGSVNIDGESISHQLGWLQEVETLWLFIPCIWYIRTFMISAAAGILFINRTPLLYPHHRISVPAGLCGMFLCSQLQHYYYY